MRLHFRFQSSKVLISIVLIYTIGDHQQVEARLRTNIDNRMRYSTDIGKARHFIPPMFTFGDSPPTLGTMHQIIHAFRSKSLKPNKKQVLLITHGSPSPDKSSNQDRISTEANESVRVDSQGASGILGSNSGILDKKAFGEGWTFDMDDSVPPKLATGHQLDSYSPVIRLLTSFNPVGEPINSVNGSNSPKDVGEGVEKLVGTSVYGAQIDSNNSRMNKSESVNDAIKLHDEMFGEAARDGKVRVRMYFHQATHDDPRLYGTGPWKYWGNGWGLEFGLDPKSPLKDKAFYQRGYTIERAFGRDFCKDHRNCRKSDPDFFKNYLNAGKYSEEVGNRVKLKFARKPADVSNKGKE